MNNPSFTPVARDYRRGDLPQVSEPLTEAEGAIMDLVCEGFTNEEIAHARLSCRSTVRSQVSKCLRKLEARNRTHAAVIYTREKAGAHNGT